MGRSFFVSFDKRQIRKGSTVYELRTRDGGRTYQVHENKVTAVNHWGVETADRVGVTTLMNPEDFMFIDRAKAEREAARRAKLFTPNDGHAYSDDR